ncbi:MAG: hypothetical protein JNK75_00290 [Betaproteobacteria bacterium]|nr:hypothetical protein [Betaproteobacteria bacterium]
MTETSSVTSTGLIAVTVALNWNTSWCVALGARESTLSGPSMASARSMDRSNTPSVPWVLREVTPIRASGAPACGVTITAVEGALAPSALVAVTEQA